MKTLTLIAAATLTVGWFGLPRSSPLGGVADAPPVVVKTVPESGAADVDPNLKVIRVTFSKKMTDKSWSWTTDTSVGESLPGTQAPKFLADGKTCVMPVKLEAGKAYATWLNSNNFRNFKDADGRPAVPYLLVFETKR